MSDEQIVKKYAQSKCPRAVGHCRDIEEKELSAKLLNREFEYIKIIQDCNMAGEYLRYFLFETSKGAEQIPYQCVGSDCNVLRKFLWPNLTTYAEFRKARPLDGTVYEFHEAVKYKCYQPSTFQWILILSSENVPRAEVQVIDSTKDIVNIAV